MGRSRRSPSPVSGASPIRISTVFLCTLILLISSVVGRSRNCRVDDCWENYRRKEGRLHANEGRLLEDVITKRRCNILKRLRRCLHRDKKLCRGNLMFHTYISVSDANYENANCSKPRKKSPASRPDFSSITPVLPLNTSFAPSPSQQNVVEGGECYFMDKPRYKHCGMFGDPHLRTFQNRFYTCSVKKAWALIDNDYMVVMATNVPVSTGEEATVTTKITVLIKAAGKCAEQRHYSATSNRLPGAFDDGSIVTGSVFVNEIEQGKHVEIRVGFIDTTVIIRQVSRYLTLAVQMPEELISGVTSKRQLCVHGCPAKHRIDPVILNVNPSPATIVLQNQNGKRKSPIKSNSKRSYNSELPVQSSAIDATISEKEARKLCRKTLLEEDESEPESAGVDKGDNREEKPKSFSSSLSSVAFSSLVPSPSRKGKRGRRKNQMAAARMPKPEEKLYSFHQLHGSQVENKDSELPVSHHHKRKSKQTKKTKRDVSKDSKKVPVDTDPYKEAEDEFLDFNFYFESCVFDLVTTGDVNFTLVAKAALEDLVHTHVLGYEAPGASLAAIRNWDSSKFKSTSVHIVDPTENPGRNAIPQTRTNFVVLLLCLAFSCIYVQLSSIFCFMSDTVRAALRIQNDNSNSKTKRTHTLCNCTNPS